MILNYGKSDDTSTDMQLMYKYLLIGLMLTHSV